MNWHVHKDRNLRTLLMNFRYWIPLVIVVSMLSIIGLFTVGNFAFHQLQEWRIVPGCESGAFGYRECWGWGGNEDEG